MSCPVPHSYHLPRSKKCKSCVALSKFTTSMTFLTCRPARRSGTKRPTDHRQHMKKSPSITRAEDRRTFMQSGVEQPHKRHTRREGLFVGWASGMVGANDRPGETKWQCQEANTPGHGFSGQDLLQGGPTKRGRERGRESRTISILTLMCLVLDGLAIVHSVANLKLLRK